jgi:hypothetical protein
MTIEIPQRRDAGQHSAGSYSPPVALALCYASGMKKFVDYIRAAVVPRPLVGEDTQGVAFLTRVCRWWLEFGRNLLVVAGFFFIAQASNILVLKVFAYLNLAALSGTIILFFNSWHLRLFPYITSRRPYFINLGLWVPIHAVMVFGSMYALYEVSKAFKVITKV